MTKKMRLIILGLSLILLSGCGDDSSDNQTSQTIQGVVIGSHYEGAWVCVDINSNGRCDEEPKTVSDANGNWTLDDPQNRALNVVAEIYVDNIKHSNYPAPPSATLVEKPMIFIAPLQGEVANQLIVSPISTMVYRSMQENGMSFEVAKESLANELGVSSDVLLTHYDVENPSPDHVTLQQHSAVEIEKLEVTMSYHNNEVSFQNDDIQSGRYVVKDYSIPSDQDPDHNIKIGTVVNMSIISPCYYLEGLLTFRLGRKGSTDVANWWKNRVSSDENIHHYDPDKLNFAMKGDLTVKISGKSYVFSDFYIGQGHWLWENVWWIGSRECSNTGDDEIMTCNCIDESGDTVKFKFTYWETNEFLMDLK